MPNNYQVNYNADVINRRLEVTQGNTTFNLNNNLYSILNAADISGGNLNLQNGTLEIDSGFAGFGVGIDVGPSALGILNISNGGILTTTDNSSLRIGDSSTGNGTVTVTGSTSQIQTDGDLLVSVVGQAQLNILNGATVNTNANVTIAEGLFGGNPQGTATVNGTNSVWNIINNLGMGSDSNANAIATLNVENGASINIGENLNLKRGTLNIQGGSLQANDIGLGQVPTGTALPGAANVLIDGTGSTLSSQNSLFLTNSILNIQDGGQVESQGSSQLIDSTLNILNGGQLTTANAGNSTFLNNINVLLSDNGSSWNAGFLRMRDGSLNISNGADMIINRGNNQFGNVFPNNNQYETTVTVNGGASLSVGLNSQPTDPSSFIAPVLILTSGAGTVNDEESVLTVSDSNSLVEIGRSFHVGGVKYIVNGEEIIIPNLLPGNVFVENGAKMTIEETLILFNNSTFNLNGGGIANIGLEDGSIPNNTLRVGLDGTLEGTGIVNGNLLIDGGTVSPGISPGVLNINGNYTQESDGLFVLEIGGLNLTDYDQILANGDVFLDGTLELAFIDGFLPQNGDLFNDLITGLNIFGDFNDVIVSGLAPGWQYQLLNQNGSLNLVSLSDAQSETTPEPSSIISFGLIALGLTLSRKKQN